MSFLRVVGPGLVAGAADVDPTTVATMAVIGATTVFGLSWLVVLMFPMLAVIQVISAEVGVVTRCDLQTCVAHRYGKQGQWLLLGAVLAVCIVTIAADLEGGAAALGLLFHDDWQWFVVPLAAALALLLLLGGYDEVQKVLRFLLLGFLAYVVSTLLAHPDWPAVFHATFLPRLRFDRTWTQGALAVIGTTLTSYVYVWQTIEEAEEAAPLEWIRAREAGATLGIFFTIVICWFILVGTGATLGTRHLPVDTADQAAQALRPLAGDMASTIFAVGLLASAVVALPVLMATCAYVVGAEFDWERGVSKPVRRAPRFYTVLLLAVGAGALIAFSGIPPIRLLFIASILGGLGTPVGLVFLLRVAGDHELMAARPVSPRLRLAGWVVTAVVSIASLAVVMTQFTGG